MNNIREQARFWRGKPVMTIEELSLLLPGSHKYEYTIRGNPFCRIDGSIYIGLSSQKYCAIDEKDFDDVKELRWVAHKNKNTYYVECYINSKQIKMHCILNPSWTMTDHIDRNGLNNRRSNIREADRRLNRLNSKISADNKSGFRGVYWHKRNHKWCAQARDHRRAVHLGYFDNPIDAHGAFEKHNKERA